MLKLKELLNPNSFLLIENPTSKKMVFDKICDKASKIHNINKNLLIQTQKTIIETLERKNWFNNYRQWYSNSTRSI